MKYNNHSHYLTSTDLVEQQSFIMTSKLFKKESVIEHLVANSENLLNEVEFARERPNVSIIMNQLIDQVDFKEYFSEDEMMQSCQEEFDGDLMHNLGCLMRGEELECLYSSREYSFYSNLSAIPSGIAKYVKLHGENLRPITFKKIDVADLGEQFSIPRHLRSEKVNQFLTIILCKLDIAGIPAFSVYDGVICKELDILSVAQVVLDQVKEYAAEQ